MDTINQVQVKEEWQQCEHIDTLTTGWTLRLYIPESSNPFPPTSPSQGLEPTVKLLQPVTETGLIEVGVGEESGGGAGETQSSDVEWSWSWRFEGGN